MQQTSENNKPANYNISIGPQNPCLYIQSTNQPLHSLKQYLRTHRKNADIQINLLSYKHASKHKTGAKKNKSKYGAHNHHHHHQNQNKDLLERTKRSWMFRTKQNCNLRKMSDLSETQHTRYQSDVSVFGGNNTTADKSKIGSLLVYESDNSFMLSSKLLQKSKTSTEPAPQIKQPKKLGFGTLFDLQNRRFQIHKTSQPGPTSYCPKPNSPRSPQPSIPKKPSNHRTDLNPNKINTPGPGAYLQDKKSQEFRNIKEFWLQKKQDHMKFKNIFKENNGRNMKCEGFQHSVRLQKLRDEEASPKENKKKLGYTFSKSLNSVSNKPVKLQTLTKYYLRKKEDENIPYLQSMSNKKFQNIHQKMFSNNFLPKNDHAFESYLNQAALSLQKQQSEYIYIPGKKYKPVYQQSPQFLSKVTRKLF